MKNREREPECWYTESERAFRVAQRYLLIVLIITGVTALEGVMGFAIQLYIFH